MCELEYELNPKGGSDEQTLFASHIFNFVEFWICC